MSFDKERASIAKAEAEFARAVDRMSDSSKAVSVMVDSLKPRFSSFEEWLRGNGYKEATIASYLNYSGLWEDWMATRGGDYKEFLRYARARYSASVFRTARASANAYRRYLAGEGPSKLRAQARAAKTYVIRETATGRIKIGRSVDPEKRLSALQTGSSSPLKLLGVYANVDERTAQMAAESAGYTHLMGEWYAPPTERH